MAAGRAVYDQNCEQFYSTVGHLLFHIVLQMSVGRQNSIQDVSHGQTVT